MQTIPGSASCSDGMITIYLPYGPVAVPSEVYARLDEWAKWVRIRSGLDAHGQCASAEGNYVSRYPGDQKTETPSFDLCSVLAVEKVVSNKLPRDYRDIVCRHFVDRFPPLKIARTLGIHRAQYGHEFKRAVLMVKNNLTRV